MANKCIQYKSFPTDFMFTHREFLFTALEYMFTDLKLMFTAREHKKLRYQKSFIS